MTATAMWVISSGGFCSAGTSGFELAPIDIAYSRKAAAIGRTKRPRVRT
jgi:hypothetical protein